MASDQHLHLLDLPEEIIETIVSYLTYHECSETRIVCKLFNKLCQQRLNKGFAKIDKLHAQIQKEVKNKLPRRESERRNHQLARHVDILSAIETRLSLLGMSYMKYMDSGLSCFIPGKVLDELQAILHKLQSSDQPPRSHEFLQELRDISSMAMEHFDEKIVPGLKNKLPAVTLPYPFSEACSSSSTLFPFQSSPVRGPSMRSEITNLGTQLRAQSTTMQQVRKDVSEVKIGYTNNKKRLTDQEKKIIQQGQVISELEKKVSDMNQKFIDLSAELQKLKEVKEGGESSKAIAHLHEEEYTARKGNSSSENKERVTRNKGLKRKNGGHVESRVKKSKN
ncbi:F-box only protein 28-like [Ruditapes philippinarum]|uniref:F-box only protein 28-like n=1 Tax=Ruditapes philippinarum TaxID=129788 RepID=UPI00295C10B5|nr:F-box only protein 28-like [Ruditapes philippinarum]